MRRELCIRARLYRPLKDSASKWFVSGHDFSRANTTPIDLSSRGGLQADEGSAFDFFSSAFNPAGRDQRPVFLFERRVRLERLMRLSDSMPRERPMRRKLCNRARLQSCRRKSLILSSRGGLQPDEGSASTTFSSLFGRADKTFHSSLIPSEGWARFVSGHDFSRAESLLL
jgi:hypothetical protein